MSNKDHLLKTVGEPNEVKKLYYCAPSEKYKFPEDLNDCQIGKKGNFGQGFYFYETIEESEKELVKKKVILEAEVKVGVQYCPNSEEKFTIRKLKGKGSNSIKLEKSTGVIYCVYDPTQVTKIEVVGDAQSSICLDNK
jgi:hypothetical protein